MYLLVLLLLWVLCAGVTCCWQDKGSGAAECVSIWRAVPPPGYVALGCVAVASYVSKPVIEQFRCVHSAAVSPSTYTHCAWTDALSGAASPVSMWAVSNASRTFVASTSYARPNASLAVCLSKGEARSYVASSSVLAWLVRLFGEIDVAVGSRSPFAFLRPRLFRPELVCGLVQLVKGAKQRVKAKFTRLLACVLLRAGDDVALNPWSRCELTRLRDTMELMHARQSRQDRGFSPMLQALVELFVGVAVLCDRLGISARESSLADDVRPVCTTEWFVRLMQGVRVMQALSERKQLPDSFVVAEDTFARLIAMDESVIVESHHGYHPAAVMTGVVSVPGAVRLLVTFDTQCSVEPSHALVFKRSESSRDVLGAFAAGFGSYVRPLSVDGNSLWYTFPGAPPASAWAFEADTHGAFKLADGRCTATVVKNKVCPSVLRVRAGMHTRMPCAGVVFNSG